MKEKFSLCNNALILICIANFLNLFVPRVATEETGGYLVRLPIQLLYIMVLVVMLYGIFFFSAKPVKKVISSITLFIVIITSYIVIGAANPIYDNVSYSQYLKFITWLAAIVFFLRYGDLENKFTLQLAQVYIFLFILVATKKMIEARMMVEERTGGDSTGLTLVLLIPAVLLIFDKKMKIVVTVVVSMLIMLSVRRTAIIALVAIVPYIFYELKAKLKPGQIFLFLIFATIGIYFTWGYLGDTLSSRFESLLIGDKGGTRESYGSGRSDFYAIAFNGWIESPPFNFFFGHGVGSVKDLFRRTYGGVEHAHNDFLEILYTYGFVAFVLWGAFLVRLFSLHKLISRYAPHRLRLFKMSLLSFMIIALSSGTLFKVEMLVFSLFIGLVLSEIIKNRKLSLKNVDNAKLLNTSYLRRTS